MPPLPFLYPLYHVESASIESCKGNFNWLSVEGLLVAGIYDGLKTFNLPSVGFIDFSQLNIF